MTDAIAAELLKLRTTRTAIGFLIAITVLTLGFLAITASQTDFFDKADVEDGLAGTGILSFLLLVLGAVGAAGEHRHGTITPSLLAVPDRTRLVAAKVVAYGLAGIVLGAAAMAVTAAVGIPWMSARDAPVDELAAGDYARIIGGGIATAALMGAIGAGIGSIVPNQVAAVVGALLYLLVAEPVIAAVWPEVGAYLIGGAAGALSSAEFEESLEWWQGGLVLLAWAFLLAAIGAVLAARRDVT
jgi:ABC-2 type transport system permease protein